MTFTLKNNLNLIEVSGTVQNVKDFAEHGVTLAKSDKSGVFWMRYKPKTSEADKAAGWGNGSVSIKVRLGDVVLVAPDSHLIIEKRTAILLLEQTK